MSKAFTKDNDGDEDNLDDIEIALGDSKNYMTPSGFKALQDELRHLMRTERPKIVEIVSWAAGNGDRSENGDYIYGKKRLREIDRRARYITKRLESAEVVNPSDQKNKARIFFGATVIYAKEDGTHQTVTLVGIDEADLAHGKISWISPIAKALIKSGVGDTVEVRTPSGITTLEVVSIGYGQSTDQ